MLFLGCIALLAFVWPIVIYQKFFLQILFIKNLFKVFNLRGILVTMQLLL